MKENVLSTSRKAKDKTTRLKMTIVQGKKTRLVMFTKFVYNILREDYQTFCHVCNLMFRNIFLKNARTFPTKNVSNKKSS